MNERIRLLAEHAFLFLQPVPAVWQFYDHELEKFTELIVGECISTLENAENGYRDYRNQIEDGMRDHCIGLLKHKFGVEE